MTKKKPDASPPANARDGRVIDLLLPVLTKLGISARRVNPDTLAGLIDGLLEDTQLWCEIWGEGDMIGVQISSHMPFFEERLEEIRAKVERANNLPECGAGKDRWLKIVVTALRPSGGRHVMLIAKIEPPAGDLTPEFCEVKITALAEFMRKEWPLK